MIFTESINALQAISEQISVINKNITNSGINGYKSERLELQDIYSNDKNGMKTNYGIGVIPSKYNIIDFSSGKIKKTGKNLDLSINKDGFFQIQDNNGSFFYTRDGEFHLDHNNNIVHKNGMYLTGFLKDNKSLDDPLPSHKKLEPINLNKYHSIPPKKTESVDIDLKFNENEISKLEPEFLSNKPLSYNFKKSILVFDELGIKHSIGLYWKKITDHFWFLYPMDENYNNDDIETLPVMLEFTEQGKLVTPQSISIDLDHSLSYKQSPNSFLLNLNNISESKQANNQFSYHVNSGYPSGELYKYYIENNGNIVGSYDNKQDKVLGKIAITKFYNVDLLKKIDNNIWAIKNNVNPKEVFTKDIDEYNCLNVGYLEGSNVNIQNELSKMVVAQKNYQSIAESIKIQDKLIEVLLNDLN